MSYPELYLDTRKGVKTHLEDGIVHFLQALRIRHWRRALDMQLNFFTISLRNQFSLVGFLFFTDVTHDDDVINV